MSGYLGALPPPPRRPRAFFAGEGASFPRGMRELLPMEHPLQSPARQPTATCGGSLVPVLLEENALDVFTFRECERVVGGRKGGEHRLGTRRTSDQAERRVIGDDDDAPKTRQLGAQDGRAGETRDRDIDQRELWPVDVRGVERLLAARRRDHAERDTSQPLRPLASCALIPRHDEKRRQNQPRVLHAPPLMPEKQTLL